MKKTKKLLALLLMAIMVLGTISNVYAEELPGTGIEEVIQEEINTEAENVTEDLIDAEIPTEDASEQTVEETETETETVPEASTPVEINSESETESESYVIVSKDGLDHSNDPHPEPNYTEVDLDTGLVPWPEIEYVQVMGITQEILDDMGLTAKELWRKVHKCLHNLGYCEHGAMARFATFKGREVDELDHKVIYYFFELTGDYIGPDTGITIYKYHNQWEMCRGYHIYEYHD